MAKIVSSDNFYDNLALNTVRSLAFNEEKDFNAYKSQLKAKFIELTGIDEIAKNACPLNFEIESEVQKDGYKQIRFSIESEKGCFVPCYILIPDGAKEKLPVVITLQGHASGFHNSIGEVKFDGDKEYQETRGKFAVQAVKEGYIAVAIEQRGMGESRLNEKNRDGAQMCTAAADYALILGRTQVGERVWDISKVIDALSNFEVCDLDKIAITGNSGGGTSSFYSACYDERIKLSVPSCGFCTYFESLFSAYHCACNFIPSAYKYFDMPDLASLIAPRNLSIVYGGSDYLFLPEGVEKGYETVEMIYEKAGAKENAEKIKTEKGHYWCVDVMWPTIKNQMKRLGWIK